MLVCADGHFNFFPRHSLMVAEIFVKSIVLMQQIKNQMHLKPFSLPENGTFKTK